MFLLLRYRRNSFIFWRLTPYQIRGLQDFLPFRRLPLHSAVSFAGAELFSMIQSYLFIFIFAAWTFDIISTKITAKSSEINPYVWSTDL